MNKKFFFVILALSTIIINILFILSGAIYNNTLHNSGNWVSIKARVARPVPASASFMNNDLEIIQRNGDKSKETFFYWNFIPILCGYSFLFSTFYLSISTIFIKVKYKPDSTLMLKYLTFVNFYVFLVAVFIFFAMYTRISRIYFTSFGNKLFASKMIEPLKKIIFSQSR